MDTGWMSMGLNRLFALKGNTMDALNEAVEKLPDAGLEEKISAIVLAHLTPPRFSGSSWTINPNAVAAKVMELVNPRVEFIINDAKRDAYMEGYQAHISMGYYTNPYATRIEKEESDLPDPMAHYWLDGKHVRAEALVVDEDTGQFHCLSCHHINPPPGSECGHMFGCPEC